MSCQLIVRMIKWWIIFCLCLSKFSNIHCENSQCIYTVQKSDNSSDICSGDQCFQFIDLYSIMVKPRTCKTSYLSLSFSSYKTYILFRNRHQWKLGDLFQSRSIKTEIRQFKLYIDQLNFDARPFDHDELIHLGVNIDFYLIYIRDFSNENYLHGLIHYDYNDPQWKILKVKFRCLQLAAFDQYPCSSEIISPSVFAPQRPSQIIQTTTERTFSRQQTSTKFNEEKKRSIHFILIIFLPLLIIFITIFIFIVIDKHCFDNSSLKEDRTQTSKSLTPTNPSNHFDATERISPSSLSDHLTVPTNIFTINQMQNSMTYNQHYFRSQLPLTNNNQFFDGISLSRQQYFVPISSSFH